MTRKFSELFNKMPPEAQAEVTARVDIALREMALAELRRACEMTQQQLARSLNVNQASISKCERQTDMYLSTLRSYVHALGGELDIVARFADCAIRINQFETLGANKSSADRASESTHVAGTEELPKADMWTSAVSGLRSAVFDRVWEPLASNTSSTARARAARTSTSTSRAA